MADDSLIQQFFNLLKQQSIKSDPGWKTLTHSFLFYSVPHFHIEGFSISNRPSIETSDETILPVEQAHGHTRFSFGSVGISIFQFDDLITPRMFLTPKWEFGPINTHLKIEGGSNDEGEIGWIKRIV